MKVRRDVKSNPAPGDIFRFGGTFNAQFIEVLSHDPRFMAEDVSLIRDGVEYQLSLPQFREEFAEAEVIRRGAPCRQRRS